MKKSKSVLATIGIAAASALPLPALGQDGSLYLGGSMASAKAKDACTGVTISCNDKDISWGVFAGFQINRNFGAEIGGRSLGKTTLGDPGSRTTVRRSLAEFLAVAAYPMERASVYVKAGPYHAKSKLTADMGASASSNNTGWTVGTGLRYDFTTNFGARLEWQRYYHIGGPAIGGKTSFDVLGVAGLLSF
jgi:opacity protein-like surface antigen